MLNIAGQRISSISKLGKMSKEVAQTDNSFYLFICTFFSTCKRWVKKVKKMSEKVKHLIGVLKEENKEERNNI